MLLREYQDAARRTMARSGDDVRDTLISALGLAGEAGEVTELVKKHHGHGHHLDLVKLSYELGDVLWYLADLASRHELDLGQIATQNVAKLRERYPLGFTPEVAQ